MNKRQTNALQKRLHRQARNHCANHVGTDGCLVSMHGKCVLSIEADRPTANVCPYFMKAVGPSNPKLMDEYLRFFPDDYPLKPKAPIEYEYFCSKCGDGYERNSNRQIYCTDCAQEIRRNKERIRQQKRRAGL